MLSATVSLVLGKASEMESQILLGDGLIACEGTFFSD
jgi:hypothetical protein